MALASHLAFLSRDSRCPSERGGWGGELTVHIRLVQDLGLNDLLDDILQGDQAQHLIEGVTFALVVHLLHDGQVGLPCRERTLTLQLTGGLLFPRPD